MRFSGAELPLEAFTTGILLVPIIGLSVLFGESVVNFAGGVLPPAIVKSLLYSLPTIFLSYGSAAKLSLASLLAADGSLSSEPSTGSGCAS